MVVSPTLWCYSSDVMFSDKFILLLVSLFSLFLMSYITPWLQRLTCVLYLELRLAFKIMSNLIIWGIRNNFEIKNYAASIFIRIWRKKLKKIQMRDEGSVLDKLSVPRILLLVMLMKAFINNFFFTDTTVTTAIHIWLMTR